MTEHPIIFLAKRYPQLSLPIREGMRETELYKDCVLRGKPTELSPCFSFCEKDTFTVEATPAGDAEILYLHSREDFEHAVMALGRRCEPSVIPASMGASVIGGLINWEKLRPHMESEEDFAVFTSDKRNYTDSIIILSSGGYSAVTADKIGIDEENWLEKSLAIRKYHELAHFVSQRLFPKNREALRDEIVADMTGIIAAFGSYRADYARLFLGIEGEIYREGGRLQNYADGTDVEQLAEKANMIVEELEKAVSYLSNTDIFDILQYVEENRIGMICE